MKADRGERGRDGRKKSDRAAALTEPLVKRSVMREAKTGKRRVRKGVEVRMKNKETEVGDRLMKMDTRHK